MKVTVDPCRLRGQRGLRPPRPQVFSVYEDEDGEDALAIANDGEVPAEHAAGVRDAVTRCPKMALTLDE